MVELNLLPWREQLREERKRQFIFSLAGSVVLALLIVVLSHTFFARQVEQQRGINNSLQREITQLNRHIREINDLKQKKQQMVQRLHLIHELQASRPLTVRFYDELVRILPVGVYLETITRENNRIILQGKAQSNTRISEFMRNIEKSRWLNRPNLSEIKTVEKDKAYRRHFILQLQLKTEK